MAEDSSINEFGRHFVMGGVSAAIAKTAAAPIERVKLLLQNESALVRAGVLDSPYRGVFDCFRRVYTTEGLVAFWRGNSANVIREVPTQALAFSLHDHYRQFFASDPADGYWRYFAGNVASGSAAGSTALLVVYPLDYARTRLANDAKASSKGGVETAASPSSSSSSRQFNGLFDVFRKTVASDGVAGLYRGFVPSIAGAVVYRGLQFGLYDTLKPIVLVGPLEYNFPASFALGWSVVALAGLCAYPLDTIRRRMMMTSGTGTHYRNFLVAASTIVKQEGSASLMRGALANIIRGVASAGILSIYDRAQSELS